MARNVGIRAVLAFGVSLGGALLAVGCNGSKDEPALTKATATDEIPNVPVPPEDGPKLGALADVTPILERPAVGAKQLGYLHAGAQVARAVEPYSKEGCGAGWYPIRPRGFVCAETLATTELTHPTLVAMSIQPALDAPLPYTYARTSRPTRLLARHPERDDAVTTTRKLPARSGMAIVGSWTATDEAGKELRLGMLTNGLFVPAEDLEAAPASSFQGVELKGMDDLPLAFVVKEGVRQWRFDPKTDDYRKGDLLPYHAVVRLTGRFRTQGSVQYWAATDDTFVRHRDVTVIRRLHQFPAFATGEQRWIDLSIVTGTATLYVGKKPFFTTLVSVGRDRLGDPKTTASTAQGEFDVVAKHITAAKLDPKLASDTAEQHDVPWALELSSGQLLHGAYWHDRFGIEHTPGGVHWSPADAQRVWRWATPEVPTAWHGVNERPESAPKTIVRIRK